MRGLFLLCVYVCVVCLREGQREIEIWRKWRWRGEHVYVERRGEMEIEMKMEMGQ